MEPGGKGNTGGSQDCVLARHHLMIRMPYEMALPPSEYTGTSAALAFASGTTNMEKMW